MGMNPRLLRPTAGGFSPKSIGGIEAWWDASDSSTITTVSGAVSAWASKAGQSRTVTQSVAANRPALTTNYYAGKSAVTFDGLNDSLAASSLAELAISPATVIVCVDSLINSTTQDRGVLVLSSASVSSSYNNGGGLQFVANSLGRGGTRKAFEGYARAATGGYEVETVDASSAQPVGKCVYTMMLDGTTGRLRQNGLQVDSQAATVATSTTRIFFGSLVETNSASLFWNGRLLEVCLYTKALQNSEVLRVERYLGQKWGITVA